jgi:gag-polypeptide of LTR copia-type
MGSDDYTRNTPKYGLTFKKLSTTEDYPQWRQHMENALITHGLWDYVKGLVPQPPEPKYGYKLATPSVTALQLKKQQVDHQARVEAAQEEGSPIPTELPPLISEENAEKLRADIKSEIQELKMWMDNDRDALIMITYMVSPSALQPAMGGKTSKELWEKLERHYAVRGPRVLQTDFVILKDCQISNYKTPVEYIKAITEAASRLQQMGIDMPEDVIVLFLQSGLSAEWNSVKTKYLDRKERRVSLEDMNDMILTGIPEPSRASKPTANAQFVTTNSPRKSRFLGTCNHCHKVGHKERDCWIKHPELFKKRKTEDDKISDSPPKKSKTGGEANTKDK